MGAANLFEVRFSVVKVSAAGKLTAFDYRKDVRKVFVQATSNHPKDLLAAITNNVALAPGESIEIVGLIEMGVVFT